MTNVDSINTEDMVNWKVTKTLRNGLLVLESAEAFFNALVG